MYTRLDETLRWLFVVYRKKWILDFSKEQKVDKIMDKQHELTHN